jgi:mitochondrial Rho GTPase 1
MDCSAKKMINVSELMLFATKAVLHPTAPLYDTGTHELKPACVRALTRIFALCDADRDGVLSDAELNKFQREVFGSPLVGAQITGIKNLLRRNVHDGITDAGITVSGFIYLHKLFIQRGRSETTWEVLRAFYYGPNLRILRERLPSLSNLAPDQNCQLTAEALSFLTSLFWLHDKEGNGSLSPTQLKALFADKTPGILWEGTSWQTRQVSRTQLPRILKDMQQLCINTRIPLAAHRQPNLEEATTPWKPWPVLGDPKNQKNPQKDFPSRSDL